MLVSFVIRLRPDRLALGELVGMVEDVETGATHTLREAADLVAFCRRMTAVGPADDRQV